MKDKIPFYNIVNMFFVGAVFSIMVILMFVEKINIEQKYMDIALEWNFIVSAFMIITMYEMGFIINRAASVLIGEILVKTKIWEKGKYDIDISEISANNPKFQSMITELNLMRSHILIYLILTVLAVILKKYLLALLFAAFVIIFVFGGKKHNTKINIIRTSYYERYKKNET